MSELLSGVKITRCLNSVAAGTSDQAGTGVDMENFEGVVFVALLGVLTASQVTSLKAQQSSDNGSSDSWADLASTRVGPMADDDDDQALVLDVFKPLERYVRPVVVRGTANAEIDGLIAIQYQAGKRPTTQDAATIAFSESHASPAEGSA